MRFFYILVFTITFLGTIFSQEFKPQVILADDIFGVTNLAVAELTGNDKFEIIASSSDKIIVFSDFTEGQLGERSVMELEERIFDIKTADLDADGDLDIFCGSYFSNDYFYFIENQDGILAEPVSINETINSPFSNEILDLDGDGLLDIVVVSIFDDKIVWLKNLGSNNFSNEQTLISNIARPSEIDLSDFNADGFIDVLVFSSTGYIKLLLNDGNMNFTETFEITKNFRNFMTVCDLNGDGLPDFIADKTDATGSGSSMYINQGSSEFVETKIPSSPNNVTECTCTDLNMDENIDLIFSDFLNDQINIHINNGVGIFEDLLVLEGEFAKPLTSVAIDIDLDGDKDLLIIDEDDHSISFFENAIISNSKDVIIDEKVEFKVEGETIVLISENIGGLKVFDYSGRLVLEKQMTSENQVDISTLKTGMYILSLSNNQHEMNYKFFKRN